MRAVCWTTSNGCINTKCDKLTTNAKVSAFILRRQRDQKGRCKCCVCQSPSRDKNKINIRSHPHILTSADFNTLQARMAATFIDIDSEVDMGLLSYHHTNPSKRQNVNRTQNAKTTAGLRRQLPRRQQQTEQRKRPPVATRWMYRQQ